MRTHRLATLLAVSLAATAVPVSAQEDITETPSAGADSASPAPEAAPPEPTLPVKELGGVWRRIPAGPFGAADLPAGWTGTELVIVDPEDRRRAAAYRPSLDRWEAVAKPPRKLMAGSTAEWTGSELVFIEPRGTASRGLTAYHPGTDAWRTTAAAPINEIAASAWAEDVLVVTSAARSRAATYDPAADVWTELPSLPGATPISLHPTGEGLLALVAMDEAATEGVSSDGTEASIAGDPVGETRALAFVPLDLDDGAWGEPIVGPLVAGTAPDPLSIGDSFVFFSSPDESEPAEGSPLTNVAFDPATDTWAEVENACGLDTTDAVWTGTHLLSMANLNGWKAKTDRCLTLPPTPWPERTDPLRFWSGKEVIELGGSTGGKKARRDGTAYDPFGEAAARVRLDKGSRPVRIRIPSLGIDLPVVWDGRKITGGSAGYPACDVAEYWSAFGEPGEPGTSWILAHAQAGMFLPLLSTLNARGKKALLGRDVQVQLRDGRLLTYRTYKVNPRATNTSLGTKNLKKGEHRLILQTSTGVGSDPKLLVAARLVDATTTDEPRPTPDPRACG